MDRQAPAGSQKDREHAAQSQLNHAPWQQVASDFDLNGYWEKRKNKENFPEDISLRKIIKINTQKQDYSADDVIQELTLLETKIREKKSTSPKFNELLFVELHLASYKLAALIMDKGDSVKRQGDNLPALAVELTDTVHEEMALLKTILQLTTALINDPTSTDLASKMAALDKEIDDHINDYNNISDVKKYRHTQSILKKFRILQYISSTIGCILLFSSIACMALANPFIGVALLGTAIGVMIGVICSLWRMASIEDKINPTLQNTIERRDDRQSAIFGLFKAVQNDAPKMMGAIVDKKPHP